MKDYIPTQQNQISEQEEYDVQKIVAERKDGNRTLYLVKWLGYSSQENTWEPYSNLKNVPEKIRQWKNKKNRRIISKEIRNQLKAMHQSQINSSSDIIENKKYRGEKTNNRICLSQSSRSQSAVKSSRSNVRKYERVNEKNKQQNLDAQKIISSRKRVIQKIVQSKKNFKKIMVKKNRVAQPSSNQSKKKPRFKSQRIDEEKYQKVQIDQSITSVRNEEVQSGQSKQKIVIEIQDSCDVQPQSDEMEEEIIVEQSVSYSSQSKQKPRRIQPPQFFLNIQSLRPQEYILQNYLANEKDEIIKTVKSTRNENKNADFFRQLDSEIQQNPQIELMQQLLLSEQNCLNVFESEHQNNRIQFQKLVELKKIQKQDGVLLCTLICKNGRILQKISYESVQIQRPDLIENFFRIKT